jgi:hypothetical protein
MDIKIFVEGIADKKFLIDYISYIYSLTLKSDDIVETGGWTRIYSQGADELIKIKLIQNSDNGGVNLLIFDADLDYQKRLIEIQDWKNQTGLDFEIFLWPNDIDSGDLETLLEKIINPINSPIFDCWENYETCLKSKTINGRNIPLTIPAKKTKIYGYLESLLGVSKSEKEKIKERSREYKNTDHWDLNSRHLDSIKSFLDKFFIND